MRIDGLPSLPNVRQAEQRNEAVRQKKPGVKAGDTVEISAPVRETAELQAAAKAAPAEPNPRISEIKARVQSGYYNSDEVKQQIADALLQSDGMRQAVDEAAQMQVAKQKMPDVPDTRPEAVDQARQRVDEGYYDRPEVLRGTVDKIVDELA